MSGDVQPRKRKDKKKKKDDLGIEEPRGTAAALGEGDVFMHSHHDHGTGGHWCAKVIFFSLLAVLVTLIGLIILENRGLSDLEANSVESRYSGVLEGWLEEGHDDDHHDQHTLELNHHDDEDDDEDHSGGLDNDDDHDVSQEDEEDDEDDDQHSHEADEEEDDDQNSHESDEEQDEEQTQDADDEINDQDDDDDDDERNQEDDDDDEDDDESNEGIKENDDEQDQEDADHQADDDDNDSEEQNLDTAEDEDEVEEPSYRRYYQSTENQAKDDDDDDDDEQKSEDGDYDQSVENDNDDQQDEAYNDSQENDDDDNQNENANEGNNENSDENDQDEDDEDHEDHNDHQEDESDVELEHIEEEVFDEDVSKETPARRPQESDELSKEADPIADTDEDEIELLESDELDDLPEELPIPVPKGRPLVEVEEAETEKPQDTLADEEEYERQQEALRKEKEQASQGMWLKLVVGAALLVATQAVLRRATAPRESEDEDEVNTTREETPLSDRRMTLIGEPVPPPVTPKSQEVSRPVVQKGVTIQAPVFKSAPPPPEEDDEEEIIVDKDIKPVADDKDTIDKELYSDEEEEIEEEEDIEEEPPKPISKSIVPTKEPPKPPAQETPKPIEKKEPPKIVEKEPTPEDDDVEIIEEEEIGEDLEEEEDEISDVDDAELLTRLEAKYGRLPEPERPGRKTEGGNSIEDEWPGEPSDAYWRDELDHAERDLRQGEWTAAAERASAAKLRQSARARYIVARALDSAAEAKRDNSLLTKAIAAYLELLKMNEKLADKKLIEVADRALDRMKFRGNYLGTEPLYRLLIRRFPDDPMHRNNLTVSFLMANRVDLAEEVIKETLKRWPNDRLAMVHYGFILKTLHNKHEEAVDAFTIALEGDTGPACEPRFYYHLGDSLLLLGRFKEAHEVHKRGAKLGHFLSPAQRSLYNVDRLKSQPWWDVEKTPYVRLARALEKSWKEILKEGRAAQELYEKEKEGLKERGEWSQLDLFVQGREVPNRCSRAPVTCSIVRSVTAASGCRRGQVKFSSMEAGTHVRPHVGPTNCRLRMHLGLSNTKDTYIRVDQETRQWQTGKVLMFDDSFEHEVWHNGTGARLVLIVDVWHPDLTRTERAQLPAI